MFSFLFRKKIDSKNSIEEEEDFLSHPFFARQFRPLNADINHRCALMCSHCGRQTSFLNHGKKVPGRNLTLEEFDIITNHFARVSFCGQYSDPIHHPQFIDMLKMGRSKNIDCEVHVASTFRSEKWFIEAFKTHPDARWVFGIDGLPEESHKYRVNQDGIKLFNIMLESRKHINPAPRWQYIIFQYNQDHIEEAMKIAADNGLMFELIKSARWDRKREDKFKPTKEVFI